MHSILLVMQVLRHPDSLFRSWSVTGDGKVCVCLPRLFAPLDAAPTGPSRAPIPFILHKQWSPQGYTITGVLPSEYEISMTDLEMLQAVNPVRIASIQLKHGGHSSQVHIRVFGSNERIQVSGVKVEMISERRRCLALHLPGSATEAPLSPSPVVLLTDVQAVAWIARYVWTPRADRLYWPTDLGASGCAGIPRFFIAVDTNIRTSHTLCVFHNLPLCGQQPIFLTLETRPCPMNP